MSKPDNSGPRDAHGARSMHEIDLRERSIVPPGLGLWGKVWFWLKFWLYVKTARLRFIAVLAAVGVTIAYWDTLKAHYDRWTRPTAVQATAAADIEFWCPMHPTILRDKPDKCPICGMPLSKRKKDEQAVESVPPGVVSRVQLTPYRVALAGIQTAEVVYQPLTKEISTVGTVEFDERRLARIAARATGRSRIDKLYVNVTGQIVQKGDPLALLYSPDLVVTVQNLLDAQRSGNRDLQRLSRDRLELWGIDNDQMDEILRTGRPLTHLTIRSPISGHIIRKYQVEGEYVDEGTRLYDVADISAVWIEAQVYEDDIAFLREGLSARATTRAFPNRAFRGEVAFIHPHLDAGTRTIRVRFDMPNPDYALRPGMYASVRLHVPTTQLAAFSKHLLETWQKRTAADLAVHALLAPVGTPAGASLEPLLDAVLQQTLSQQGLVLAVPERAVIDTGSRTIVYRETEPKVYDGIEVQLGPRSGGFYPVVRGLEAGDRIATTGSFLIDAETRLTAGASSTYFGASAGPQTERQSTMTARPSMPDDEDATTRAVLAKLNPRDRRLAEAQKVCPVLDTPLGSMGKPVKIVLKGQPVLLCCKGCEDRARAREEQTLAKVRDLKAKESPPQQ